MEDEKIVDLYWARSQEAIRETSDKYASYCRGIAFRILRSAADSDECVNDTYLRAWNAMPPHRPSVLSAFLGKITRNLSLDRWKKLHAQKRGSAQVELALDELAECLPAAQNTEEAADAGALAQLLNGFLAALPAEKRRVFLKRYWYLMPAKEIAREMGLPESTVRSMLLRTRQALKGVLEQEGFAV